MKAGIAVAALALAAGLVSAAPPPAAPPAPGEYATQPGGGTLTVRRNARGNSEFSIFVVGANAHTCDLGGWIEQGTGTVAGDTRCRVRFTSHGPAVDVTALDEACRDYCGMRAVFERRYVRLPTACMPAERDRRNAAFLVDYRARRYAQAHAALVALQRDCGAFLDWISHDALANDRAITELHLGRAQACLHTLKDTRGATLAGEAALRDALAPTDYESYLPVAQATWTNLRLCRAALAKR
jgi:hypothetical protein